MKEISPLIIVALFLAALLPGGCRPGKSTDETKDYKTINYLEVARLSRDSVKAFPVVIDIPVKNKHLIFIGTNHVNQVTPQADTIENVFNRFAPQIAFNEGGAIPPTTHFNNRDEAILKAAETGELKFLCDRSGINMVNGDLEDSTEWAALFNIHPRGDVLMYMSNERFIDLYVKGWIDTTAGLDKTYQREFIDYYAKRGVKFREEEKHFSFIQETYRNIFHADLDIHNLPGENFYFLSNGSKLCELGRNSKVIRDKALLKKIENAFRRYDKVLVVFGGSHAIALQPALYQLMDRVTR